MMDEQLQPNGKTEGGSANETHEETEADAGASRSESQSTDTDENPGFFRSMFHYLIVSIKWVFVSVMVVGILYLAWVNYAGDRAKERALQKMKARGLHTSVFDMRNDMKPDDPGENGASYYRAAFELPVDPTGSTDKVPYVGESRTELPEPGKPLPNEWKKPLQTFTTRNKLLFNLLKKARSHEYHAYNLQHRAPLVKRLSLLSGQRSVAQCLLALALHQQMQGKPIKAAKTIQGVLHLVNSFRLDRFSTSDLIRTNNLYRSISALQGLLSRDSVPAETLRELDRSYKQTLKHMDLLTLIKMNLAGRASSLKDINLHTAKKIVEIEGKYAATSQIQDDTIEVMFEKVLGKVFGTDNDVGFWEQWTARIQVTGYRLHAALAPGYYESILADKIQAGMRMMKKLNKNQTQALNDLRTYDGPSETAAGEFRTFIKHFAEQLLKLRAKIRVTRTALAVERFRINQGRWPSDRSEITGKWYDDPFGKHPLKLKNVDNGMVIYSVGLDGTDNGGTHTQNNQENQDITFRLFDPDVRGQGPKLDPSSSEDSKGGK